MPTDQAEAEGQAWRKNTKLQAALPGDRIILRTARATDPPAEKHWKAGSDAGLNTPARCPCPCDPTMRGSRRVCDKSSAVGSRVTGIAASGWCNSRSINTRAPKVPDHD